MTEITTFQVQLTRHALLDCLPLRFGLVLSDGIFTATGVQDEQGTQNQKPREQKQGIRHFIGSLSSNGERLIDDARIVVAPPRHFQHYPQAVSVMLSDSSLAARTVSDLIRAFRERGDLTPEWIAENLHPLYAQGNIRDETEVFTELLRMGVANAKRELSTELEEIKVREQQYIKEIEDLDQRLKEQAENAITQDIKQDPQYKNEAVDISPIATLDRVWVAERQKYNGQSTNCTFLSFKEGLPVRKMDAWADPTGQKTELAKRLIGKQVWTTTWQPERFDRLEWFRNIYEVTSPKKRAMEAVTYFKETAPQNLPTNTTQPNLDFIRLSENWKIALQNYLSTVEAQQNLRGLRSFLRSQKGKFHPKGDLIFRALNELPFEQVRVVILGNDPYPKSTQATGLSFSTPKNMPLARSVRNIYRGIVQDIGGQVPSHGNLEHLVPQGVLLLNRKLTTATQDVYDTTAHANVGWEEFTNAIIRTLSDHHEKLIFFLWGNVAKEVNGLIDARHCVLRAPHPSWEPGGDCPFLTSGKGQFLKANAELETTASPQPITWFPQEDNIPF